MILAQSAWTPEGWVLLLGALVTAVPIFAAALATLITAWRTSAKLNDVAEKTSAIEAHVNSAATKAATEREAMVATLDSANRTITELKQVAVSLAQAQASTDQLRYAAAPPKPQPPVS
jgi:uncharacterized membrane protein YcjF (UPF0283 family)